MRSRERACAQHITFHAASPARHTITSAQTSLVSSLRISDVVTIPTPATQPAAKRAEEREATDAHHCPPLAVDVSMASAFSPSPPPPYLRGMSMSYEIVSLSKCAWETSPKRERERERVPPQDCSRCVVVQTQPIKKKCFSLLKGWNRIHKHYITMDIIQT